MNNVLFSHKTDDWRTPKEIYNYFLDRGYIDTFPFCSNINEFENNYKDSKLFINPPFSKMNKVIDWVVSQHDSNHIIMLLPVRSDTIWFQKLMKLNPMVFFLRGRLHYNDSKSAPFPSCFVIINRGFSLIPLYYYGDFETFKRFVK